MYSVPTGILDKKGKLTAAEWERVRLHAYHTERVLARSALLADAARIASLHHERLDGSGYHRGERAAQVPMAARILAAADVLQALGEPRPQRPPLPRDEAARELEAAVARGALDARAAAAVCEAAGARTRGRKAVTGPAGLTEREVEVLRLLARGRSKKQIAQTLFIAHGTVHTHVTHIYEKLGVSSRAAAALFAMEQGLLPD
jgi:DNA-binding CsgD family transcriptional regulator